MSDKQYNVVYAFKDTQGNIRYIGKARCFEDRMKGHQRMIDMVHNPPPLYQWLSSGEQYSVDIIYQGDSYEKVEKRLIKKHSKNGLYNIVYNTQPMQYEQESSGSDFSYEDYADFDMTYDESNDGDYIPF